jgi:hypothetical protein
MNPFLSPWVRLTLSGVAGACLFGRVGECELDAPAHEAYGKLPLSFEANNGQTDPRVQFLARGAGYSLFLTGNEAVFVLSRRDKQSTKQDLRQERSNWASARPRTKTAALKMSLVGANAALAAEGLAEQKGKANYLIGNDAAKWRTNVSTFGRVQYKNVYSGIDLTYYGNQQQLEYDFTVQPKADYKQIKLDFKGAKKIEVEEASGDLLLSTKLGVMHEHRPKVYQEINGERKEIASRYVKRGKEIGFEVEEYDATLPLVIDPALDYSTYLGGNSSSEQALGIAVDSSGNVYVTGFTGSTNFPTKNPFQATLSGGPDAFVTKLSANGQSLVYSTYLGGSSGSDGHGIAIDLSGNAYVTGETNSADFPTKNPLQARLGGSTFDVFITKLSADGQSLIYSTFLGGSSGTDTGHSIAVDSSGNAYVAGSTNSINFPTKNPFQASIGGSGDGSVDGFVAKLSADGQSLIYFLPTWVEAAPWPIAARGLRWTPPATLTLPASLIPKTSRQRMRFKQLWAAMRPHSLLNSARMVNRLSILLTWEAALATMATALRLIPPAVLTLPETLFLQTSRRRIRCRQILAASLIRLSRNSVRTVNRSSTPLTWVAALAMKATASQLIPPAMLMLPGSLLPQTSRQ